MLRFLKWIFYLLLILSAVILGGAYYLLHHFDLNDYTPWIEKIIYQQTGRTLKINGSADIKLSLSPSIALKDVTLSNPADWQTSRNMVEVGALEVKVSLLPLLEKKVVIDKVILHRADIWLETKADGRNNWDFKSPSKQITYSSGWLIKNAYAASEAEEALLSDMLSDIKAREIMITDSSFKYIKLGQEIVDLKINDVAFSADGMDQPMKIRWDIDFDGINIKGKGDFGSLLNLLGKNKPWKINAEVEGLNVKAQANGNIYNLLEDNPKAEVALKVKNPSGNFSAPKIILEADVKADLQTADVKIKSLNVADNIIKGKIFADISHKIPFVKADLQSDLIDVASLTPPYNVSKLPSLVASAHAGDLVPSIKIPYEYFTLVNAQAEVAVKNLVVDSEIKFSNILLKADLDNGHLKINPLNFQAGKGQINTVAQIDSKQQKVELKLNTQDVFLQDIHPEFVVKDKHDFGILSGGKSEIYLDLHAHGATAKTLAESMSGQAIIIVDKAEFQSGKMTFLTNGFFQQLLDILKIDISKSKKAHLNCAVVRADLADGRINFPSGIAFDSDNMNLIGDGRVDLKTDKLKMGINAYRNNVADISVIQALSNLIKISGKIQSPKISIDRGGALKTIASVAAGPAYAGAGMFLEKDTAPCHTALNHTAYQNYFPEPSGVRHTVHKGYKGTENMVTDGVNKAQNGAKSLEKNVKSLFNNLLK